MSAISSVVRGEPEKSRVMHMLVDVVFITMLLVPLAAPSPAPASQCAAEAESARAKIDEERLSRMRAEKQAEKAEKTIKELEQDMRREQRGVDRQIRSERHTTAIFLPLRTALTAARLCCCSQRSRTKR